MAHPSGGTLAGIRLRSCIIHREFESRRCFLGVSQHQKRPHFAVDDMTIYQQSTPDQPAGALEHPPGTTEANRSSAVQIELVGFAGRAKSAAGLKIWAGSAAGSRPRTASPGFGRTVPRRPPSMVKTRTATIGINRIGPYGRTLRPLQCTQQRALGSRLRCRRGQCRDRTGEAQRHHASRRSRGVMADDGASGHHA
jgi:hypothetical protein